MRRGSDVNATLGLYVACINPGGKRHCKRSVGLCTSMKQSECEDSLKRCGRILTKFKVMNHARNRSSLLDLMLEHTSRQ